MMRHAPGATCAQQAPTRRTHHRSREGGPWPARVRLCPGMGGTPQRSEPWLFTVQTASSGPTQSGSLSRMQLYFAVAFAAPPQSEQRLSKQLL